MKTKINSKTKQVKSFCTLLLCLFISLPLYSQEIELIPFDGICVEGLVYNPAIGACDWEVNAPEQLRFKSPVKITQNTTFKILGSGVTFTVSTYDFFECSLDGRSEKCGCSAIGTAYLFVGYTRYTLC